ncbi:MAG: HugZ family protein [Reyranellaceae bacterium]
MSAPLDIAPATRARDLMRRLDRASLATSLPADGLPWPYASLVLTALDHDLSPILLVSDLAEHSKAIASSPRVCLLFDGTAGLDQPLTGPRLSVFGVATRNEEPRLRARFLARHPDAQMYADFRDFNFYRVAIERAHFVAGFGRIDAIDGAALRLDPSPWQALIDREADIVSHMNEDHADAVGLYATRLLGLAPGAWRMTGVDADGCDLRCRGQVARLSFDAPVLDAEQARKALVELVRRARAHAA